MRARTRRSSLLFAIGLVASVTSAASPAEIDWRASIGLGHDDNVYREAEPNQDAGGYLPYDARVSLRNAWPLQLDSRITLSADGGYYASPLDDGKRSTLEARWHLDRTFRPQLQSHRTLRMDLGIFAVMGTRDRTYYSRSAGEEMTVVVGDSIVFLGDRYDSRYGRMGASCELRLPGSLRAQSRIVYTSRDYKEDYSEYPDVESYDYKAWRWNLELRRDWGKHWRTELEGALAGTRYDEWSARDYDGNKVFGERQSFDYRSFQAGLRYRQRRWGWLRVAVEHKIRRDPFLGYYDYDQIGILPQLHLTPTAQMTFALEFSYLHRDYKRARVGFNPVRSLREDFDRFIELEWSYALRGRVDLIGRWLYQNVDEANAAYTFDRSRYWIGLQFHS